MESAKKDSLSCCNLILEFGLVWAQRHHSPLCPSTPFSVSVVHSRVYSVYIVKYIYFLYMHIFITIFALTWTNGFIFFHKGCYIHGGLLPHLFCMSCSKLVCPTLLIPRLLLRSQHCTFVILTSQLWNKQGRLQVLLVLASRGFIFACFRHAGTADAAGAGLCSVVTIGSVLPGRESWKTTCLLKVMLVSILEEE